MLRRMNLGLLLGVGIPVVVLTIVGLAISLSLGRRKKRVAELEAMVARSGERIVAGPCRARKREGHTGLVGALVVTEKRLLFDGFYGEPLSIPFADILTVRRDAWFNTSYFAGCQWLILTYRGHSGEVGFVTALPEFETALKGRLPG